jgi:hypothetical protein
MPDLALFSDWNDALTGVVHAQGGHKKVGTMLRPELGDKPDAAAQWLRDCLNPEKRERLNPDQVFLLLRLARENDYHAAKHWMDSELGYEQGRPLKPTDEMSFLLNHAASTVRDMRALCDRLERLTQAPISVVHGRAA